MDNKKNLKEVKMAYMNRAGYLMECYFSDLLTDIKHIEEMKKALSGDGISSEELMQMSNGFITMGENLSRTFYYLFSMKVLIHVH